jgi:hypothetical protein
VFAHASPQIFWQATLWIAFGTVAIIGMLLIALFWLKLSKKKQDEKAEKFQKIWQPILMDCALSDGIGAPTPQLAKAEEWLFIKLWVRMQTTLRGQPNDRLRHMALKLGCANIARRYLISKHRSEQVYGLMTLAYLHEATDWELLLPYLSQARNSLAVYASIGLLQIDAQRAAPLVISQLLQRPDIDLLTAASVFKPFRKQLHQALSEPIVEAGQERLSLGVQRFNNAPVPDTQTIQLTWLFKVAHALEMHISTGVLLPFLQTSQPIDLIIGAMRLVKVPDGLPAIRSLAQHKAWEVRNQVCITLGKMGDASDLQRLSQLMMDSQWWVRYRAAQALMGLPFIETEARDTLVANLPDRYARDMAKQVLAERGASA